MTRTSVPAQVSGSVRSAFATPRKVASGPYIPPTRAIAPPVGHRPRQYAPPPAAALPGVPRCPAPPGVAAPGGPPSVRPRQGALFGPAGGAGQDALARRGLVLAEGGLGQDAR